MTVKSLRKQLAAAIAMTLVATVALGSSTYAWFSFNNTVSATGMEVHTKVEDNLLIAKSSWNAKAKEADGNFTTSDVDILSGLLEPVSTIDGLNFYWTAVDNVDSVGNAISEVYTLMDGDGQSNPGFLENYNHTNDDQMKGYVDYVFQLKATNSDASVQKNINITDITLTYGNTVQTQKAFRAAVFVKDMGETGATAPASSANNMTLKTILAPEGAAYMSAGQAVGAGSGGPAVINLTENMLGAAATIGSVDAGKTQYYQVAIRLWLEGEDNTCNNTTFATLKDKWGLSLKMQFGGNAKQVLGNVVSVGKVTVSTSTALGEAKYVDGKAYYPIGDLTLGTLQLYTNTNSLSEHSTIFVIDNDTSGEYYNHPVDVTNQITFE